MDPGDPMSVNIDVTMLVAFEEKKKEAETTKGKMAPRRAWMSKFKDKLKDKDRLRGKNSAREDRD